MSATANRQGPSPLAAFLVVLAISPIVLLIVLGAFSNGPTAERVLLAISCAVFCALVLFEIPTMRASSSKSGSIDRGFVSGALTIGAVFYCPAIDALWLEIAKIETGRFGLFLLGIALTAAGGGLRRLASSELGQEFSHEIRIRDGHRLVSSGIYAHVRHPAYAGTLAVLAGMSLMLGSYIGPILLPVALFFVLKRIATEEKVLETAFPSDYPAYKARTKKLFPGIL